MQIKAGEWVCLLGDSGIGKTTLLRIIEGQYMPQQGEFQCDVNISSVFQKTILFPHLNVLDNVIFILRRKETWRTRFKTNKTSKQQAQKLLKQVHMEDYADAMPHTLSGGQQQRVAIAQVLAQKSKLLLMDEPFAALDESTREQLQELLIRLQNQYHFAVLLVTHNLEEALYLGHQLYLLRQGKQGATLEQYDISGNYRAIPEIKQSEAFFKQLQDLRAYFYRSQLLKDDHNQINNALDRGLIDETILVELESTADEVWVISKDLRQDMDNPLIHKVVSKNLQRGVCYYYIIPENSPFAIKQLTHLLTLFNQYKSQIFIYTLAKETSVFYFGEVVFFNPHHPKSQGFSYLNSVDKGLMMRLSQEFIEVHIEMIERLKCEKTL